MVSGSWLIAFGDVVHRYASPYRGGGLKGRRGWLVVGALMGAPVADRRSLFVGALMGRAVCRPQAAVRGRPYGARCLQTAGRSSQNHATLTSLGYGQLFAAGRPLGRPLRWPQLGHFLSLSPSSGIRRGRPKGVPLRAEGFPKRRCQFESDAAQRHLSPRRPAGRPLGGPYDRAMCKKGAVLRQLLFSYKLILIR